jgi:hypothetical protein
MVGIALSGSVTRGRGARKKAGNRNACACANSTRSDPWTYATGGVTPIKSCSST